MLYLQMFLTHRYITVQTEHLGSNFGASLHVAVITEPLIKGGWSSGVTLPLVTTGVSRTTRNTVGEF